MRTISYAIAAGLVLATVVPASADDSREAAFRQGLHTDGFVINDGAARRIDPAYFVDEHIIDSAGGNNAGQAYKALQVPIFPVVRQKPYEHKTGVFRLREDEAVVYLGPTPPAGDYFSFTPFLFVRKHASLQPKGDWMFAALGNPLNNMRIKTAEEDPFAAQTMIVFTADRGIYERVVAQAQAAGFPTSMINQYPLPSSLLRMGVLPSTPKADSLLILVRTANLASKAAESAYMKDANYATVWRVTPKQTPTADPFPVVPMAERSWQREKDLFPELPAALDRLKKAILAKTPHVKARTYGSTRWWPESRQVLKAKKGSPMYHQFVAGEAADTPYRRSARHGDAASFSLGTKDMVVVYGVNHAATGLATYSNFSVYTDDVLNPCGSKRYPTRYGCGDPLWSGVTGMADDGFQGSASKYLPGDPMAKYLYAVKVSRKAVANGKDKYWITVPQPASKDKPATGIRLDQSVLIGYRAYLNPNTGVGPAYSDVMHDRALWMRVQ